MWFRVDDKLHDHRKIRRAGAPAMGLWVMAGSWCRATNSDGFCPDLVLKRFADRHKPLAARLVAAGLWTRVQKDGEWGYQFHDWDDWQPTKEQVRDLYEKRRSAGRKGGLASATRRRGEASAEASAEAFASNGEASAEAKPKPIPIPIPTTPLLVQVVSRLQAAEQRVIDDDEVQTWKALCHPAGLASEAAAFLAHNHDDLTRLDHPTAAWRGWLKRAAERSTPTPAPDSLADVNAELDPANWCEHANPQRTCVTCRRAVTP